MNVITYRYAMHTAHLCPMTGDGLLVLPLVEHDLGPAFYAAAWDADLAALASAGYSPDHEGDHLPILEGYLPDGREVVMLRGEGVISAPSIEHLAEASAALRLAAGLA